MTTLENQIKNYGFSLGFDLINITSAKELGDYNYFKSWIKNGNHGTMAYMEKKSKERKNLKSCLSNVESIICCALNYYFPPDINLNSEAVISNYAQNYDYHDIIKKKLKELAIYIQQLVPNAETKVYCDTAPILERAYAQQAGLGWIGKNTCLINPKIGSWIFLGEILCNFPLTEDKPANNYCGTCRKCLDICPTQAFTSEYQLDSRKCISYLTIELREEIPSELREKMGNHLFGCDLCQVVCPFNKKAPNSNCISFSTRNEIKNKSLSDWLELDEEKFKTTFTKSPVKRTKFKGFMRNIIIATGNSKRQDLLKPLAQLIKKEEPLFIPHIEWAIKNIKK